MRRLPFWPTCALRNAQGVRSGRRALEMKYYALEDSKRHLRLPIDTACLLLGVPTVLPGAID